MASKCMCRTIVVAAAFATVAAGCAGGAAPDDTAFVVESMIRAEEGGDGEAGSVSGEPSEPDTATSEVEGGVGERGPIDRWEDVPSGVVQVIGEGAISDFDVARGVISDLSDAVSSGSGFLVAEDGIIVTNNHVVTGAASVRVQIQGESQPRNARVLGASECWDLAVIEVLDGEDLPWFRWASAPVPLATEVYAVGFPFGDPEITVTRGIVSRAVVDAQTRRASIDSALETDASINRGNSGGPLVTADGEVVGVNFATNAATRHGLAISAEAAERVVAQLRSGRDVDYLGINGVAFTNAEVDGVLGPGHAGGVFVQSVETGSDAFNAGLRAGEVIVEVEGTGIASDGTMAEYCDILRSRGDDQALTLTVLGRSTSLVVARG